MPDNGLNFQIISMVINGIIALAGTVLIFTIKRLVGTIDTLIEEDKKLYNLINVTKAELQGKIFEYREEMLAHYVRHPEIEGVRKDLVGRVDRLEHFMTNVFREHEVHEKESLEQFKQFIVSQITHFKEMVDNKINGRGQ